MAPKDERPDEPDAGSEDEYDQMMELLQERISEFAEENDLPIGALSPLLLQLAMTTRMMDYALSVEKPSSSGLKLELDRMQRDFGDAIRNCKRNADEFIEHAKDEIEQAAKEAEEQAEADAQETGTSGDGVRRRT